MQDAETESSHWPSYEGDAELLDEFLKEDDQTLYREFHLGRIMVLKAAAQLKADSSIQDIQSVVSMIQMLATVGNTREKRKAPPAIRMDWEDPAVVAKLEDRLKELQIEVFLRTLEQVLSYLDDNGRERIMKKLPRQARELLLKKEREKCNGETEQESTSGVRGNQAN
jgi:hypothetical protein